MSEDKTISAQELKRKLDAGQVGFLFDLRNEDEFKAWRIEGRSDFPVLNIPQEAFVGEEELHLEKFPKDRQIITVCAHGDAARYAADQLRGFGLSAAGLEGGMDAWSEFYEARRAADDPIIYQVYRVARGCISYLIASGKEAVVIDAARHTDRIEELAASLKVRIVGVFDTHLHADHISGGPALAEKAGAPYRLHPDDAGGAALRFVPLADGQSFTLGACVIDVIHSPGHTPGSTSLLVNGTYLFTGDTIMKTAIGRPDLGGMAGAWSAMLHDTLFRRFKHLDDAVIVLPSHAASSREQDERGVNHTTLGAARRELDLYQLRDEAAFTARVSTSLPENPQQYQQIRQVNLGALRHDEPKLKELEIGKNLCGMAAQDGSRTPENR